MIVTIHGCRRMISFAREGKEKMKCENCGSERIAREIGIITKYGFLPEVAVNDPLSAGIGPLKEENISGWKGKVWCQECGSESEWIGEYVILSEGMDKEDVETDLLRQAHERMRTVAPPDQTTLPEICPCRACGGLPTIKDAQKGRLWIEHKCGDNNPFLALCANQRQAILAWNKRQENKDG